MQKTNSPIINRYLTPRKTTLKMRRADSIISFLTANLGMQFLTSGTHWKTLDIEVLEKTFEVAHRSVVSNFTNLDDFFSNVFRGGNIEWLKHDKKSFFFSITRLQSLGRVVVFSLVGIQDDLDNCDCRFSTNIAFLVYSYGSFRGVAEEIKKTPKKKFLEYARLNGLIS